MQSKTIQDKKKANNNGTTPLSIGSQTGHREAVMLLLEARASVDKAFSIIQNSTKPYKNNTK